MPVQALALPLLTTMACPLPDFIFCMQILTGAALTAFVVKVPAIDDSTSEKISAKSFLPGFLIAASVMEKKKPPGVFSTGVFFHINRIYGSCVGFQLILHFVVFGKSAELA